MITTEYTPEYRPDILRLGKEFEDEFLKEFGLSVNEDVLDYVIETQKGSSFLMVIDGKVQGFLSGELVKSFCVPGLSWSETVWFVSKPYRRSRESVMLFETAMRELKARGVKTMMTAHLFTELGEKMGRYYKRKGFKPLEVHYIKKLGD